MVSKLVEGIRKQESLSTSMSRCHFSPLLTCNDAQTMLFLLTEVKAAGALGLGGDIIDCSASWYYFYKYYVHYEVVKPQLK